MSFGLFKDRHDRWVGVGFLELGQGALLREFDLWCEANDLHIIGADDIDRMGWDRFVTLPTDEAAVLFRLRWEAQVMPPSVYDIFQGFIEGHIKNEDDY